MYYHDKAQTLNPLQMLETFYHVMLVLLRIESSYQTLIKHIHVYSQLNLVFKYSSSHIL